MKWLISVSFGELILKGHNRKAFEDRLIRRIKRELQNFHVENIYMEIGKLYIEGREDQIPQMMEALKKVFGLVYISPVARADRSLEGMEEAISAVLNSIDDGKEHTFKIRAKRTNKSFPIKSPEINSEMGGYVLKNYGNFKVDVHDPDYIIYIDVKDHIYCYTERIAGLGGLPLGSSGHGLLLLSGGIDSPVAGFLSAKRGVKLSALYFHSYPFTSDRAEEKVKTLSKKLTPYCGEMTLYSVNILNIQTAINRDCRERYMTILTRRFMMRIAERLCREKKMDAMITGESLGQVASQTIQSIGVIDEVTKLPILRPLITMDKNEIIDIARSIDTYDTSILPYEDCCTVFLPDRPVTKPRLDDILREEEKLDIEGLIDEAMESFKENLIEEEF